MSEPAEPTMPPAPVYQPSAESTDVAAPAYTEASTVGVAYPRSPILIGALAGVLLVAAIGNFALSFGFPSNAPVEWFLNAGTSLTLVMAAITLGILAFTVARMSRPKPLVGQDAFAVTGAVLTGIALLLWLTLGGGAFVVHAVAGGLRYMYDVAGIFWAGFPWVLGMIFGALGYRHGAGAKNLLAYLAVGVGLLLIVPTIASAVIYALDLSP